MWQKVSCNAVRRKIFVQNIGLLEKERERGQRGWRLEKARKLLRLCRLKLSSVLVGWMAGWLAGWFTPIKDPFPGKEKTLGFPVLHLF